ncbi:MAG: DEAD/DEAH box helicase, partial [Planctomycetota bacterium]
MPATDGAYLISKETRAEQLEITVTDAAPWPALKACVQVNLPDGAAPLSAFYNATLPFDVDALDRLLLRRLMRLPLVDNSWHLAAARDFAPVLALLRQHSRRCAYSESPRISAVRILSEPAEAILDLAPGVKASDDDAILRVVVRLKYRNSTNEAYLGEPIVRGETFWTFDAAISPPPRLPNDALLRSIFAASSAREYAGHEALDLLYRARAAANAHELTLRMNAALPALSVASQPLQKRIAVNLNDSGNLEIKHELTTADGQSVPTDALKMSDGSGWVNFGGRVHRLPDEARNFELPPSRVISGEAIPEFLASELPSLKKNDSHSPWNIYVSAAVEGAHEIKDQAAISRFSLDTEDDENRAWFTLDAVFDHDGQSLTEEELRRLLRDGKKWFRKGSAWIKLDANALKQFEQRVQNGGLRRHFGRRRQFYYRFKPAERERVTDLFSLVGTVEHTEKYRKFLDNLNDFQSIERLPLPRNFRLPLRSYQQQGFEWLWFLTRYHLNGILADDMGLGKTAQTIAVLSRLKDEHGQAPSLIITPTSLTDNWRNEIAKFNPSLSVLVYRGSLARRDQLRKQMSDSDVVLATYALARNDASLLREIEWRHIILDEAHFIKNSAAATTKAIKTIPSRHRLALTGTPIQNRLSELWSLFDFLMPDFLGRRARFYANYEEPITRVQADRAETIAEQEAGDEARAQLRERIRPFVLRRLKTDVAKELPPKIENDISCGLTAEQVALYRGFADTAEAQEAVNQLVTKGANRASVAILAALTSLRKICNHADLMCLPKNEGRQRIVKPLPGYEQRSGKLEALGELLQQCREGGHRALIFCQLTSMLDILGHFLNGQQITYLRLDGETPVTERQKLVEKFNAETSFQAFLISTRAGGTGLNLTGADTVIFYDHDWNPANDQQAEDRAHRIGQHRAVNVYRLICR